MVVRTCTTSRCAPCLCFASVNQRHEDDEPPRPCGVRLGVLTACGVVMLVKPASPLRCSPRPWRVRLEKLRYSPDTDSAAVLPAKVVRTRTEALQIRSAVWARRSHQRRAYGHRSSPESCGRVVDTSSSVVMLRCQSLRLMPPGITTCQHSIRRGQVCACVQWRGLVSQHHFTPARWSVA